MSTLTQVTSEDIERLNSSQLVDLLRILLFAEARKHCIPKPGIHVPFQITVPDGGNDGEWNADVAPCDYIPNKFTIYQVKAQALGPAACKNEIIKKGTNELKSQVERVLDAGGAFAFFCRKGYVKENIDDKIDAVRESLKNAGRASWETDEIHFFDGNRIAAWANDHAAGFVFVCRCARHWQDMPAYDFEHWSSFPEYLTDFHTNETLTQIIQDVRDTIRIPHSTARITGHSGLGKTRIAFEVFNFLADDAEEEDAQFVECLKKTVVYADMSLGDREVLTMINQLAMMEYSGIVVVDNCPRDYHNKLVSIVNHPNCKLSLLTLDFIPEVSQTHPLEVEVTPEMMKDIVPQILQSVPGLKEDIGDGGINKVAEFAQGFPQIAILTAEAGHALDLDSLNRNGTIADRLLWGRGQENIEAKKILRCLALFTEVGKSGDYAQQVAFVRDELCNGLSQEDLNTNMNSFIKRSILQKIGDFYIVAPPPLAAALAAEWLFDIPNERFLDLLPLIEKAHLTESFTKRLKQLDFSDRARELCEQLVGGDGPFSSAEVLNSEVGSLVFRSLSELNPLAATECLDRLFGNWTPEQFSGIGIGRRNLIWTLEKLVWDKALFSKAAKILRGFAAGENEHWTNNATGQFLQLFHIYLPGTECSLMDRLDVIRDGLADQHTQIRRLSVKALGHALLSDRFSRGSGPEQRGSQLPKEDYRPSSNQEILAYWKEVFELLKQLIMTDDPLSALAQEKLGSNLGTIVMCPLFDDLATGFSEIAQILEGYWPPARESIKHLLDYREGVTPGKRASMEEWLAIVTPRNLKNRLIDTVSNPGWHNEEIVDRKDRDRKYKDVSEENASGLAKELFDGKVDWIEHAESLLKGEQQQGWAFGKKCAELDPNPQALFARCLSVYRSIDPKTRNPQLLRGMLNSMSGEPEVSEILDSIAVDEGLRTDLLVPLSTAASTQVSDFVRVSSLVKSGGIPIKAIEAFGYGGVVDQFNGSEFERALEGLRESTPSSAPCVLGLAYSYVLHNAEHGRQMAHLVEKLVVMPQIIEKLGDNQLAYQWKGFVESLLKNPTDNFVETLTEVIVETISQHKATASLDRFPQHIIGKLLKEHPKDAWPIVAAALLDEDGSPSSPLIDTLARSGRFGDSGVPLWELPEEEFREWAEQNGNLIPYFLHYMQLYYVEENDHSRESTAENDAAHRLSKIVDKELNTQQVEERYVWHPHARVLLQLGKRMEILRSLHANLFSFGSTGSRVPYLEKRLTLVEQLESDSEEPELQVIAKSLIADLKKEIKTEKKQDKQRAAGIYAW